MDVNMKNCENANKVLQALKTLNKSFNITVLGESMNPILYEGDIITVRPSENYYIGDIVVFYYADKELLVHRLLNIKDPYYFCKGDNAFRLENIKKEQILGKIVALKRESKIIDIPVFTDELISLSLKIHRIFFNYKFDLTKTRETDEYKKYKYLLDTLSNKRESGFYDYK